MRSRARCFRSEVRVQLEMERSGDSQFPSVGDLIQRYEESDACIDAIRTRVSSVLMCAIVHFGPFENKRCPVELKKARFPGSFENDF